MSLDAGRLNRRIQIQMPVRAPNGQGGFTKSWSTPRTLHAEMIPLRGQEALQHNLLHSRQLWRVTIRHRPDVSVECRATFKGEAMNITACEDPDGKREQLVMTCETGVTS